MSWQARKDARLSALVREKEAQDRKLDEGNFHGALEHYRSPSFRNGGTLPRPTTVTERGRIWVFNA